MTITLLTLHRTTMRFTISTAAYLGRHPLSHDEARWTMGRARKHQLFTREIQAIRDASNLAILLATRLFLLQINSLKVCVCVLFQWRDNKLNIDILLFHLVIHLESNPAHSIPSQVGLPSFISACHITRYY